MSVTHVWPKLAYQCCLGCAAEAHLLIGGALGAQQMQRKGEFAYQCCSLSAAEAHLLIRGALGAQQTQRNSEKAYQ